MRAHTHTLFSNKWKVVLLLLHDRHIICSTTTVLPRGRKNFLYLLFPSTHFIFDCTFPVFPFFWCYILLIFCRSSTLRSSFFSSSPYPPPHFSPYTTYFSPFLTLSFLFSPFLSFSFLFLSDACSSWIPLLSILSCSVCQIPHPRSPPRARRLLQRSVYHYYYHYSYYLVFWCFITFRPFRLFVFMF